MTALDDWQHDLHRSLHFCGGFIPPPGFFGEFCLAICQADRWSKLVTGASCRITNCQNIHSEAYSGVVFCAKDSKIDAYWGYKLPVNAGTYESPDTRNAHSLILRPCFEESEAEPALPSLMLRNAAGSDCWCTPTRHRPRLPPRRPQPPPTAAPCAVPLTTTCVNLAIFDRGMAWVHVACVHRSDHPRLLCVPQQDDDLVFCV